MCAQAEESYLKIRSKITLAVQNISSMDVDAGRWREVREEALSSDCSDFPVK